MNRLVKYDPIAELNALQRQFFGDDWHAAIKSVNIPTTDVYMKDDELVAEAHLPNFDQKDVNVEVDDGNLIISAEKHEKEEDKAKKYVVRESSSSFYRRIALPERADTDKIAAHLDDGVLTVHVPVTPLPQPQKISIDVKASKANKK